MSAVRQFRAEGERPLKVPSPPAPTAVFTGVGGRADPETGVRGTLTGDHSTVIRTAVHLPAISSGLGTGARSTVILQFARNFF